MLGKRRYFASFAACLAMVAGSLVAGAPAQAGVFTAAQVTLMTKGHPSGDRSWTYSLAAGDGFSLSSGAGTRGVSWSRASGGDKWTISIHAPSHGPLTVGTYEDASGGYGHEWRKPEISLSDGSGCDGSGRFVVNQVELFPDSNFKKLDLYFEHKCRSSSWSTFGRVLLDVPMPAISAAPAPSALLAASAPSDPGTVRLFGEAPAGVAEISARVFSPVTGLEVGSTSSFIRESGTDNLGVWVSSTPLKTLGAPGFYRIDTDIVDRDGIRVSQTGVGYLAYEIRSSVQNLALDPNYVDAGRRTTQLTGVLTGRRPGTNEIQPISGVDIAAMTPAYICACADQRDAKVVGTGVTGADGSFTVTVTVTRTDVVFAVYLGDLSGHVVGTESNQLAIFLNLEPSRVTAPEVFWGPTMTISGVATYQSGQEWLPLANTVIEIRNYNEAGYWGNPVTTTMTDAQGRYSVSHTREWNGGSVRVVTKPTDPFIAPTGTDLPYARYHSGIAFETFAGFWESKTQVQFIGLLNVPGTPATRLPIAIQYQTSTGWQTNSVVSATSGPDGWLIKAWAMPPCGTSHWRAVYGVGYPDGEVVSDTLTARRGCMVPRRVTGTGTGDPAPRRR